MQLSFCRLNKYIFSSYWLPTHSIVLWHDNSTCVQKKERKRSKFYDVTCVYFALFLSDDTSHTSIKVSPLGIRKGKYSKSLYSGLFPPAQTARIWMELILSNLQCYSYCQCLKTHRALGESLSCLNFHKISYFIYPTIRVTVGKICRSLFAHAAHCYRSADAVSPAHYFPSLRHAAYFFFFQLVAQSQENNKHCNNFTIVSSPPIMPLNWSYSLTGLKRFLILNKRCFPPLFFLGARALRQFLPPVHQLFERKNANRSSYWRAGWQLKVRSRRALGIVD